MHSYYTPLGKMEWIANKFPQLKFDLQQKGKQTVALQLEQLSQEQTLNLTGCIQRGSYF